MIFQGMLLDQDFLTHHINLLQDDTSFSAKTIYNRTIYLHEWFLVESYENFASNLEKKMEIDFSIYALEQKSDYSTNVDKKLYSGLTNTFLLITYKNIDIFYFVDNNSVTMEKSKLEKKEQNEKDK
ncbi:hypothetical protein BpHYR1_001389 [Brachionus plicatilis]|uniref:Uncharacterized protein n=1 Tax=Brachionus plicatilis TaxID=10195 RepID=A0A3M7QF22_BRAPC|nr:hypothetical protein BpHYR1_001389 [Brachionus plicatilis]